MPGRKSNVIQVVVLSTCVKMMYISDRESAADKYEWAVNLPARKQRWAEHAREYGGFVVPTKYYRNVILRW